MLTCTICGRPSFAKLRIEVDFLPGSAGTYLICESSTCMTEAGQRAVDNLWSAAAKLRQLSQGQTVSIPVGRAIDVESH